MFSRQCRGWILELDRGEYSRKETTLHPEQKRNAATRGEVGESDEEALRGAGMIRIAKSATRRKARISAYESLLRENSKRRDLEIHIPAALVTSSSADAVSQTTVIMYVEDQRSLTSGVLASVIGPNGAGKQRCFAITKQEELYGTIRIGETVQLAYVDQSRTLDSNKSIWEEISGGTDMLLLGKREVSSRAYVGRFNFSGSDQQKKVGMLSGGERNRVHLAKMLKEGANVLLLDEPTNDLDVNTLRALEEALENFAGCAVVISHDRWFLDRIATHILAFEGDSKVVWFEGNYSDYEEDRKARLGAAAEQPHRIGIN